MKNLMRFVVAAVALFAAMPLVRRLLERLGFVETLAEEWFRRVWQERDGSAIDDLLSNDCVAYGIYGEVIKGPEAFKEFHAAFCELFEQTDIRVLDEIAEGRNRAVRCLGKLKPSVGGDEIEFAGMGFVEIRGGKVVCAYNYWNFLGLLEGMSLMPHGSLEAALSGNLTTHPDV